MGVWVESAPELCALAGLEDKLKPPMMYANGIPCYIAENDHHPTTCAPLEELPA